MRRMLTALALICLWSAPLKAEIRALSIGIDEYDHGEQLRGAVADARDIGESLTRFGAQDVTLLLNREADRAAIEAAWREMVARAAPGDLLILTYSGHGGYEPDLNGDEARLDPSDLYDEHFALSGFKPENPRERILDDELDLWFREALEKGLRILFVADSCHSSTMHRGLGAGRTASRLPALQDEARWREFTPPVALAEAQPPPPEAEGNFFFASAVDQKGVVREIAIEGVWRGALSYLFARAIDGAADVNRDGVIDHLELGGYLEAAIPSFDNEVRREFHPRPELRADEAPLPVLVRPGGPLPGPAPTEFPELRLALRCPEPPRTPLFVSLVSENDAPDLIYDCRSGQVLDESGGLLADGIRLHAVELRPILEKLRLVRFAQAMAAAAPIVIRISPEARFRTIGETFEVRLDVKQPWLTIFNLANRGEVQPVYPRQARQRRARAIGSSFHAEMTADLPPGADHLIVVASDAEPAALQAALEDKAEPARLLEILNDMAKDGAVAAGVAPLYALPR